MKTAITAAGLCLLMTLPAAAADKATCTALALVLENAIQTFGSLSSTAGTLPITDQLMASLPPDAQTPLKSAQASGKKLSDDIDTMVAHMQDAAYALQKCAR